MLAAHDRNCAALNIRHAYCDCALSTRNCRTLTGLAAWAPVLRQEREDEAAIARRARLASEYEPDPTGIIHRILTGEDFDEDDYVD